MKDLQKFKDLWLKMMYILTPSHKKWGVVVFILSFIGSLLELLGVSIILPFATVMVEPAKLREWGAVNSICDALHITDDRGLVILLTLTVIAVYILKNLFLCFLAWIRIKYATKVERELSVRMLKSYIRRGYGYIRMVNAAEISRGCGASINAIQQIISCFFRILTDCMSLALIVVFIAVTDIYMSVAMVIVAAIALFLVVAVFRRSVQKAGRESFVRLSETSKWFNQLVYGIKEVYVMNREDFFVNRYEDAYYNRQRAEITKNTSQTYPTYFIESLCITGIMLMVGYRIITLDNPAAYVAQLAAFAVAAFRILPSIGRISTTFSFFLFQIPFANEVYDNMREAAEYMDDIPDGVEMGISEDVRFSEELDIDNVSFMYPDGQNYVLDHVSLRIRKGESIALVGPSGAGKSTLADIILGLYIPQNGRVKMDGIDILSNRRLWSANIGFVPQSVYLLDDTVRNNIAFGHADEDIDDDRIWAVLEQAQMKEYIETLPMGVETVVGERGVRFSGGQAQRLAIARALYNDPSILVLDEATSALDNDTESAIMDAITALQGLKTLIIIAHRLTTVKNCDHIYEVRNGTLTEKTYSELV